jgi:dihydrofolate reductase
MNESFKRQIAISMTYDGLIGDGEKLLFKSSRDLANFYSFTANTAMIAGRLTAQQMISAGINLSKSRPLIVISKDGSVEGASQENDRHIYIVPSLQLALGLAGQLRGVLGTLGYTIVGGKSVYEEYLSAVDKGEERLNSAYIFAFQLDPLDVDTITNPVKLSKDSFQLVTLLKARMMGPMVNMLDANVQGEFWTGNHGRVNEGLFQWHWDDNEMAPDLVYRMGSNLYVTIDGGVEVINLKTVIGYTHKDALKEVEVRQVHGYLRVRPVNESALFSLLAELRVWSVGY